MRRIVLVYVCSIAACLVIIGAVTLRPLSVILLSAVPESWPWKLATDSQPDQPSRRRASG